MHWSEAKVTLKDQSLRSPRHGAIVDLKLTTPGFVAHSSEPLLKIVPIINLVADVAIPCKQIGFVRKGSPIEIRIDSFTSTDFGVREGKGRSIESDDLPADQPHQRQGYRFPCKLGFTYFNYQTAEWELLTTTAGPAPEQSLFTQTIVNQVRDYQY